MPKILYTNYIMHDNSQIKAANIYMAPIYMCERVELGIYGLYIYVYIMI